MDLEDLGLTVKKIRKEVVKKADSGGQDAEKIRAIRWDEIRKEEMIEQAKTEALYKQVLEAAQKQKNLEQLSLNHLIKLQIDYVLEHIMTTPAKRLAGWIMQTQPKYWYVFIMNLFPMHEKFGEEMQRKVTAIARTLKRGTPEQIEALQSITLKEMKTAYYFIKKAYEDQTNECK